MSLNDLGTSPANAVDTGNVSAEADAKPLIEPVADPAPAKPESAPEDKIQKRFDKLTREKYEAQRERDRAMWELEQLRAQAKTPAVAPQPPTLESSGYDEGKYHAAVIEYAKQTAKAEAKAEAERLLSEREQSWQKQGVEQEFETRQAEFIKSKPDYAEKVLDNRELPITDHMAAVIRDSDIGPNIAYYLAENEEIAANIAMMPPNAQMREILRIEARLETKTAAKPQVSKAPPPPAKLDSTEADVEKSPSEMTPEQFAKWRKKFMKR